MPEFPNIKYRNSVVYVTRTATENKEIYNDNPRGLWDAARRKDLENMENQQLVSPSRQCSSTPIGFGQGFLSREQRDNTGASPPPSLLTWLYLFPGLKSALKGRRFCDATDITKNAKKEPKRFSAWLPATLPTPLQSLTTVYSCTR